MALILALVAFLAACVAPASQPARSGTSGPLPATSTTDATSVTTSTDAVPTTTQETSATTAVTTSSPATSSPATTGPATTETALRFFGTGSGQVDRVKIPLTANTRANIGATDFTVETWIKGTVANNNTPASCSSGEAAWITGHIFIDRDVYNAGDYGDYGLSLYNGRVAFGASNGANGATICGTRNVLDGAWHHIAVTRQASNGRLQLYVDGQLDAQAASSPATGNISYRVGRSTGYPGSDPYLVLAAEKHDAGSAFPSFNGQLDELRLSDTIRYNATFTRPNSPFAPDASTVALYHFNEGTGTTLTDAIGTSHGQIPTGGPNNGPQWITDNPF